MNIAAIRKSDIANGPGVRVSVFVSGCRHACPGCFNREAWDFAYGMPYSPAMETDILTALSRDYVEGLTLLGGEPFEPENREELSALCRAVRERFPQKSIWCFTGFLFEDLLPLGTELLPLVDVLVDGRFEADKKSLALLFRGSSNQRILDVPASLLNREAIWLPGRWERTIGERHIDGV